MGSPRARLVYQALACAVLAVTGACSDDRDSLAGVERPASIELDPPALALWAGDTARITATARKRSGEVLEGWPIRWSSSRPTVATVNAAGMVVARDAGTAWIVAESWGRSAEAEVVVTSYDLLYELQSGSAGTLVYLRFDDGEPVPLPVPGMRVADPVPSPDRRKIAFVGWVDGSNAEIFVMERDGTGLTRLTHDPGVDDQPAWSPDGQRIAFRSFRDGGRGAIWVMNADGSDPVKLTPDDLPELVENASPAWSPDGSQIAYASGPAGEMDIWLMGADGSEPRRLTELPGDAREPSWAPDGSRIAFRIRSEDAGSDIAILTLSDLSVARLVLDGEQSAPAWSPDGGLIAFVTAPTEGAARSDIFTMAPDGSDLVQRTTDEAPGLRLNPAWFRRR